MTTLFLKYRPQNFTDIVGQDAVKNTLKNALKNSRAAHAYLFVGSRGTGKTSTARIFAKGLNSFDPSTGEVVENELTASIAAGECVDIVELDAASHTGVDNIREIIEKTEFLPTYAQRKVYIIDEVHMLSKGAFNALLKTLEEPPAHAYFILATTEFHKVPDTIISRCQTFVFQRFTLEQITDRLQSICSAENITIDDESLGMIANKAEGGLRDAISLLEQIAAETENKVIAEATRASLGVSSPEMLNNFWSGIQTQNVGKCFDILQKISTAGADFRSFGHDLLGFLRDKMKLTLDSPTDLVLIIKAIEEVQDALRRIKTSPIVQLPLEIAVVNLCNGDIAPTIQTVRTPSVTQKKTPITSPKPTTKTEPKKEVATPPVIVKETNITPEKTETAPQTDTIHSYSDLMASSIAEKMDEIATGASLPIFVKKSFLTGAPEVEGNKVIFLIGSAFHLEQINKSVHVTAITTSLRTIFGNNDITVELKQGQSHRQFKSPKTDGKSAAAEAATVDDLVF